MTPSARTLARNVRRWIAAPADATWVDQWAARGAEQPFKRFYAALMTHSRVDPAEALQALDRVRPSDTRRLMPTEQTALRRLRGHLFTALGKYTDADSEYRRAWQDFEKQDDGEQMAITGIGWLNVLAQLGRYEEARQIAELTRRRIPRNKPILRARLHSNRGNTEYLCGHFESSAHSYRKARNTFRRVGFQQDWAIATYNLGHALIYLARPHEARREIESALDEFVRGRRRAQQLYAQFSLAIVDLLEGDTGAAQESLEDLLSEFEKLGDARATASVQRELAQFLAAVGALETAHEMAGRSQAAYETQGLSRSVAHLALLRGRIMSALGRPFEARSQIESALRHLRDSGDVTARHRTEVELASILLQHHEADAALALLKTAGRYLTRKDPKMGGLRCRHITAAAHLAKGNHARAFAIARQSHSMARTYPMRFERPWMALICAQAQVAAGDTRGSLRWMGRAVDGVEQLHMTLGSRVIQTLIAGSREDVYERAIDLVLKLGGPAAPRRALDLLSRAKAPQLIEAMLRKDTGLDPELRASITRLREELLDQTRQTPSDIRSQQLERSLTDLDAKLARKLRSFPATTRRAIERRRYEQWAPHLGDRAVVFFDARESSCAAYVVDSEHAVERVDLPRALEAVHESWLPVRLSLEQASHLPLSRRDQILDETLQEANRALVELRQEILDPLPLQRKRVVLIPSGPLRSLPLECLPMSGESPFTLSRLPHPALLRRDRSPRKREGRVMLMHDGSEGSKAEIAQLRHLLRGEGFHVDTASRRREYEKKHDAVSLLHVAAHGCYDPGRWLSNGLRLADGWLGFEHLDAARLNEALVFFGSCESGLDYALPGFDPDGWMSVAFGAGAKEMVLTLWRLDDRSVQAFAKKFYGHWTTGMDAAEAADLARRDLRREMPHPFSWAPFLVAS